MISIKIVHYKRQQEENLSNAQNVCVREWKYNTKDDKYNINGNYIVFKIILNVK